MAGTLKGCKLTCSQVKDGGQVLTEVIEKLKKWLDSLPASSSTDKDSEECDHEDCLTDKLETTKALIVQIQQRTAKHIREKKARDSGVDSASEETLKHEKRKGMVWANDDNLNQPDVTKVEDKRLNVPLNVMLQQEAETSVKTVDDGTCVSSDSIESNFSDDDNTKVDSAKKRGKSSQLQM